MAIMTLAYPLLTQNESDHPSNPALWLRNCGIIDPEFCRYFEVDFPIVADTKTRKISENKILRSFFTKYEAHQDSCYNFDDGRFCLVGCNMTETKKLEQKLNDVGFDSNKLTIILTECSTTYVDVDLSLKLLHWLTKTLSNFIFIDYEQIRPFDHFGQIMKRHFSNRGSALKCIDCYPTVEAHRKRVLDLGWTECRIQTIEQIVRTYFEFSENNRIRTKVKDLFDEMEELKLKCSHYLLIVGAKFDKQFPLDFYRIRNDQEELVDYHGSLEGRLHDLPFGQENMFGRFGHSMVVSPHTKRFFLIGGYSKVKQRDNIFASFENRIGWPLIDQKTFPAERTLFCAVASTSKTAFVFGGRASPKEPSDKMFCVDIESRNVIENLSSGQKPCPRWKHSLTAVSDKVLVMVGGRDLETVFDDICTFDCAENKWTFKHRLNHGLHSSSAVLWNQKLIISGGLDGKENIFPHLYLYDWKQETSVKALTCLKVCGMIQRFSHTSHLLRRDQLLLVGGVSHAQEPGIGIVDLKTLICQEFSLDLLALHAPLTLHSSHVDEDESAVFIFGGGTNCFSFGMHLNKKVIQVKLPLGLSQIKDTNNVRFSSFGF